MKTLVHKRKLYDVKLSPLYKLSSKRKLAEILKVDLSVIANLDKSKITTQYNIFKDKETLRFITEPKDELKKVHKQLLRLFCRIAPPDYVHSAVKKRSYKTNAEQHREQTNILKIDIKKFFPSVKFHYVHSFFRETLLCSSDVATILSKICTVETRLHGIHLPTGSCISPVLSFLVNQRLFNSIRDLCSGHGCIFTLYVDDITVSGLNATRELLNQIALVIHQHGYGYHKIRTYHNVPALVTGIALVNGKVKLPHSRSKKIREVSEAFYCSRGKSRLPLLSSLIGRLSEAEQLDCRYKLQRSRVINSNLEEWARIVANRLAKAKLKKSS